jgi:hypothetical protein
MQTIAELFLCNFTSTLPAFVQYMAFIYQQMINCSIAFENTSLIPKENATVSIGFSFKKGAPDHTINRAQLTA